METVRDTGPILSLSHQNNPTRPQRAGLHRVLAVRLKDAILFPCLSSQTVSALCLYTTVQQHPR